MKKRRKQLLAFVLAVATGMSNLSGSIQAFAADGRAWGWFHSDAGNKYVEATFESRAQSDVDANFQTSGVWVATGLGDELTSTLRTTNPTGAAAEPAWYGKWWYKNHNAEVKAVKLQGSATGQTINVDFSKFDMHYNSCIKNHAANSNSTMKAGVTYVCVIGGQTFANFAYLPTNDINNYPDYIKNGGGDAQAKKSYFHWYELLGG